jgi:hypothetical protein
VVHRAKIPVVLHEVLDYDHLAHRCLSSGRNALLHQGAAKQDTLYPRTPAIGYNGFLEPNVTLKYQSGEEIKKGDRVTIHGEPGEIELVASDPGDPETDWYVQEYGGGVMVVGGIAGRTFIDARQLSKCDYLEFVSGVDSR